MSDVETKPDPDRTPEFCWGSVRGFNLNGVYINNLTDKTMGSNSAEAEKANILVVDDTPDNLRLLSAMLTERGYKIRKALNGTTALKTVQLALPDLILLDINMPGMNGYDVCQQLKAADQSREVPIIFISALNDVLDKVKAFSVGGADYITKPFQTEEVLSRVEHQLTIRQQQQQLQSQNEQLQQEIRERDRALREQEKAEAALRIYLHAVSHDLRNPVIGMSLLLKSLLKRRQSVTDKAQTDNPEQSLIPVARNILVRMDSSCDRQLGLINSLVETHELEVWGVPLQCRPLALHSLTQPLVETWEPILAEHQAKLENQISLSLPTVNADPNQLWRVFENLIANALKHNPSGVTVTLDAEVTGSEDGNTSHSLPSIRCTVTDDGIGMESEQCSNLFDLYRRGESARRTSGLGLGLYLCRQIIIAHGGEIGAIAHPGQGAQFWFTLPIAQ